MIWFECVIITHENKITNKRNIKHETGSCTFDKFNDYCGICQRCRNLFCVVCLFVVFVFVVLNRRARECKVGW